MIDIACHIEYLLLRHDCVVVPGLGAFLANEEPARYDSISHTFLAPSRAVGFNPEVRHNDGMLIESVARRCGISLSAAKSAIETGVASLKRQLDLMGEFAVGNLGMLFKRGGELSAIEFEPSAESLPSRLYSGLIPVTAYPLGHDEESVADNDEPVVVRRPFVIPTPLKVVASVIVAMITLGILYSTTSLVNGPRINYASLDTGLSSGGGQSACRIDAENEELSEPVAREIVLNIAIPSPEETFEKSCNEQIAPATPQRYLLVVGSFPSMETARRHIDYVGDRSLGIVEMDGNFRVYAATSATIGEAYGLIPTVSEKYSNVWICSR